MECRASNFTANVQSDHILHGYMLPVFFTTDQLHHPPHLLKFNPCHNASATHSYHGLVHDMRERMK